MEHTRPNATETRGKVVWQKRLFCMQFWHLLLAVFLWDILRFFMEIFLLLFFQKRKKLLRKELSASKLSKALQVQS